jgi:hypothetical protein
MPELERLLGHCEAAPRLVKDRPRLKDAYLKALGDNLMSDKDGKRHITVGGMLFFYAVKGIELKHMEKGKIVLDLSACATCLRPW